MVMQTKINIYSKFSTIAKNYDFDLHKLYFIKCKTCYGNKTCFRYAIFHHSIHQYINKRKKQNKRIFISSIFLNVANCIKSIMQREYGKSLLTEVMSSFIIIFNENAKKKRILYLKPHKLFKSVKLDFKFMTIIQNLI